MQTCFLALNCDYCYGYLMLELVSGGSVRYGAGDLDTVTPGCLELGMAVQVPYSTYIHVYIGYFIQGSRSEISGRMQGVHYPADVCPFSTSWTD